MKILSEEDGDTIWNDPLEMHEPISNNPSPSKGLLRATNNKTNKHSVTSASLSLDKRLQEITTNLINAFVRAEINPIRGATQALKAHDEAIAAIHAAFKDAGYRHNFAAQVFDHEVDKKIKLLGFRTGTEWLERFTKELKEIGYHIVQGQKGQYKLYTEIDILEAARRASDVEEDNDKT